ncbi:hypothetical protein Hypma_012677 [Hypsizygus marmoreus]|uniref:Uncharacterized protein n=1 Tax=Hypsizygus marmoreus TaxID=39966 RepID=A0A369JIQ9_HYPMA|nr:hypothetical protein Hypma_012677 [Hypsizygus marmoreus]
MNSLTPTPAHLLVPPSHNSLQGALENGPPELVKRVAGSRSNVSSPSSTPPTIPDPKGAKSASSSVSIDQDMQRQVEAYNRSIAIIIWYKAETEPIRLQHTNLTFPFFHLGQLSSLAMDLGLTPGSYLDTYDPQSSKWELHHLDTVRLVATQQRLLYKLRKNLLEGLSEFECLGLSEEVQTQSHIPIPIPPKIDVQTNKTPGKRPAPDASPAGPSKIHISNNYYMAHPPVARGSASTSGPASGSPTLHPQSSPSENTASHTSNPAPTPIPSTSGYPYQAQIYYNTPLPTMASSLEIKTLPAHLTNPDSTVPPPIPYHPHPPLKRWPNDYTVSELTAGFNAMEQLIRQPPNGTPMTQRTAFERVFGSRYVKSTVCRHRGVWRKAKGPLREQFEAMGADERACWGEFVRRIEGRPPSLKLGAGSVTASAPPPVPPPGLMMYHGHPGSNVSGMLGSEAQNVSRRVDGDKTANDEPVMASLQKPDDHGPATLQNSQFA